MGHEYCGVVEEVGSEVRKVAVGHFVVGSFFASDNTCEICLSGYQTGCVHREPGAPSGAQAEYARIALADGTLVATPGRPDADLIPSCWPPPTSSGPAGSGRSPPTPAPARPSRSSATAPWDCARSSPPQLGAERIIISAATQTVRPWRGSSARPTPRRAR